MNNYNQSYRNIYIVQKKIFELTQQYYQAIKNNLTFENIKVIFRRTGIMDLLKHIPSRFAFVSAFVQTVCQFYSAGN